ncbi:hypothetical protein [Aphanothece sacrum]|uniref:Uncharacterized protein n=1 Tax=Aphanothece sacrum FPU1 TaxID=1920663 RepID=A0A401IN59_APHSA|nr:hypothetical protein [Aphanothece sacrum]GBF82704.1 hypothetical protein AsFPU1_4138 [Aphanothece sacrum FPU1]GBF84504.1 hypothetical protein AsFPU3_1553 [Aphanothece sacrum FPU3]
MLNFYCSYLGGNIELTQERLQHILETHPELSLIYQSVISETLAKPDQIRRSSRLENALLFTRWFDNIRNGKYIVVVVITDTNPSLRHWIITAYIARKLTGGTIEWQKT